MCHNDTHKNGKNPYRKNFLFIENKFLIGLKVLS